MKKLILPIFIGIITTLLFSCDKIDTPLAEKVIVDNDTNTVVKRRVLIEEFTGQLCTSCPDGAREIERLVDEYGNQIIPISIHSGAFADPGNGAPNDFTTPTGNIFNTTFGVSKWPAGMVSRVNNGEVFGRSDWEAKYTAIKDDVPYADITITNTYDSGTKNLDIQVDTEWLIDGENGVNYKLQVHIIEDHITAYQLDNGTSISDYDHRHVFRGAVNTSWGTSIPITTKETTDTQNFNYTIDAAWAEDNCEVVAFIYKEGPNYEVIQANIAHVK